MIVCFFAKQVIGRVRTAEISGYGYYSGIITAYTENLNDLRQDENKSDTSKSHDYWTIA